MAWVCNYRLNALPTELPFGLYDTHGLLDQVTKKPKSHYKVDCSWWVQILLAANSPWLVYFQFRIVGIFFKQFILIFLNLCKSTWVWWNYYIVLHILHFLHLFMCVFSLSGQYCFYHRQISILSHFNKVESSFVRIDMITSLYLYPMWTLFRSTHAFLVMFHGHGRVVHLILVSQVPQMVWSRQEIKISPLISYESVGTWRVKILT